MPYYKSILKTLKHKGIGLYLFIFITPYCNALHLNTIKADIYTVEALDKHSKDLATYFYINLKYRTSKNIVKHYNKQLLKQDKHNGYLHIKVKLDPKLNYTYQIENTKNQLTLKAKNKVALIWVFHQFYKSLSNIDPRVNGQDLAPSIINFSTSQTKNFAFNYREPFYQTNLNLKINAQYATNNVDRDWGIWGHNLGKILSQAKNKSVFSLVNGNRNKKQICFSSPATYTFLTNYITNQFGNSKNNPSNFVIAPNDNPLVCNDSLCISKGNTIKNTAPAVLDFVKKLAVKFPHHNFYLLDYSSYNSAPKLKLPSNVGVIISSINLPKKNIQNINPIKLSQFETRVEKWKKVTSKVLVWDYITNFDDYLSPYPSLYVLKNHLTYFKKIGVTGVFCNASGYDYSTFQDVKTYISAALLINPELKIDPLIKQFFKQFYPVSGALLSTYYLQLEHDIKKHIPLNLYAGIKEIHNLYFNDERFNTLYFKLIKTLPNTKDNEYRKLKKIITALSFTYLQNSLYNKYNKNGFATLTTTNQIKIKTPFSNAYHFLKTNYKTQGITNFKEFNGKIETYLSALNSTILKKQIIKNKLFSKPLNALSKLDYDYQNIKILNDGVSGFSFDYHRGWLICSLEDLVILIPKNTFNNPVTTIEFSFIESHTLKLLPPKKIKLYINDKLTHTLNNSNYTNPSFNRKKITFPIKITKNDALKIQFIRNEKYKKFAIDEILTF